MSAPEPVAATYDGGGAIVTRCSDPEAARAALLAELDNDPPWWWDEVEDDERAASFPVAKARVTRGRKVHCLPNSYGFYEGWGWQWEDGTGRGSTPAVEWRDRL